MEAFPRAGRPSVGGAIIWQRVGSEPENEAELFLRCPDCGGSIDMRGLARWHRADAASTGKFCCFFEPLLVEEANGSSLRNDNSVIATNNSVIRPKLVTQTA